MGRDIGGSCSAEAEVVHAHAVRASVAPAAARETTRCSDTLACVEGSGKVTCGR